MSRGFNLTAEINLRGPSNIRTVVADIRRQLGTVTADVDVRLNQATNRNIATLTQSLQRLNTTLGDTNRLAIQASTSLNVLANAGRQVTNNISNLPRTIQNSTAAVNRLNNTTNQAARNLQAARTEFEEFGRQSALAVRRFAAFATVTGLIFKVTNAISTASAEFISFNKELVRVAQVTDTSVSNLSGLVNQITSLSTTFGVTSKELIQVSSTLAQAGLSARDTEKALKALALSAMAPSFDSLNDTVEGSIALMRQFGIGAKDLEKALGSVNAVSAKFAVESSDIITAIQRTGGVFAAASKGVTEGIDALNQFIAVFTSVRATTRESAETIATGLRTIFTRVQRSGTIDALKEYGVVLTDLEGKFVGPYEAVRRLAEGLNQLDPRDLRFSRIVEELGGFRQIGKVIPLIQQFATAQQALIVAQKGQGSLANDAATAQQALAVKISKVREEFIALIRSVGQSDSFQSFVKLSLDLASALIRVADSAKSVLPALTAIAAIRGASFLTQFATGFAGGIRRQNSGGFIRGFASGGLVPGQGNTDTFPAMLSPGEFVIRKKAVEKIGVSNLARVNRNAGGPIQYLNSGGLVQSFAGGKTVKKSKKSKEELSSTGPTEFTHIAARVTPDQFSSQLQKYFKSKKLNVSSIYSNMGLDLPMNWNRNWDLPRDNKGAFAQTLANYIRSKDVFKTLKAGSNKRWRFTGRGDSIAQNLLIQFADQIRSQLSQKVRERSNFFDVDDEVFGILPRLLTSSIKSVLPKIISLPGGKKATPEDLISGFEEKSAYKVGSQRKSVTKQIRAQLKTSGGQIQRFMAGRMVKAEKKPAVLSPQNLIGGPGHLAKGEWQEKLNSIITENGFSRITGSNDIKVGDQKIPLSDALSVRALGAAKFRERIGAANIVKLQKLRTDIGLAYAGKRAGIVEKQRPRTPGEISESQSKGLLFGAAGMYGNRFPAQKITFGQADGLNSQIDAVVFGALLDRDAAERKVRLEKRNIMLKAAGAQENSDTTAQAIKSAPTSKGLSKFFGYKASVAGVSKANKQLAMNTVSAIAKTLSPTTQGSQIFLDFDRTLAFGSDKIGGKINKKAPDYSAFGDPRQVAGGLASAKLSGLGLRLRKLVSDLDLKSPGLGNELLKRMFVVSARPAQTMPLIARWLRNQGLRIPPSNVSGVGGTGVGPIDVAISKAEQIAKMTGPGSVFIDDDPKNIAAAREKGIYSIQYGSSVTKKAKRQAAQQEGLQFEQFISEQLPASLKTGIFGTDGEGIDFPFGLGYDIARNWFRDSRLASIPVDTKRTLTGPRGKIKNNILSYLKTNGYNSGGVVQQFAEKFKKFSLGGSSEDTVPALLTPGEFVINKKAASKIGSSRLHRLNQADKLQGFNKGGPVGGFYRFARGGSAPGDYTANLEGAVQKAFQDFEGFMKTFGNMVNSRRDALYKQNRKAGMSAADAKQNADLRARGEGAQYLADRGVIRQGVATGLSRTLNPSGPEAQAGARFIVQSMQKAAQASQQVAQNSSKTAGFFDKLKSAASSVTGSVGGFLNRMRGGSLSPEQRQERMNSRQRIANAGMGVAFALPMLADQIGSAIGGAQGAGVAGAAASFSGAVGVGAQFGPYGALVGAIAGTVMAIDGYNNGIIQHEKELSQKRIESETQSVDSALQQIEKNPKNTAATAAVVSSLQKISTEEEKVMAANRQLRKPTTLQNIGAYFGYKPTTKSPEDIAQENTAANKAASDVAMQLLTSKVNTGMGFEAALASTGNADLIKQQIAQGAGGEFAIKDAKLRENKAKFEGKTDAASQEIVALLDQRLKENADAAFKASTAGLVAADADMQRAKAAKQVAKALNLATVSIDRTFSNMESAINKASAQLAFAGEDLEAIASGKISTKARFVQQNVLENPNAYSSSERNAAVKQAGGLFGQDFTFINKLTQAGAEIKNSITRMGVEAQRSGKPKQDVAEDIQRTIDKQLRDTFGDNNLSRQISEQLRIALKNQVDSQTQEIDLDKLMAETTGLTSLLEAEKKAYKALADAAKLATDSINLYSEQVDRANAMLNETNGMRAESIATKSSNDFRLTELLGGKVSLKDRFGARVEEGAARVGVRASQFNIVSLQNRLAQLSNNATITQQNRDQFQQNNQITDPKTIQGISNFNRVLSSLNNDIENTKKAIKDLPKDIQGFIDDTFNELQKKVSDLESKKQAGAAFAERLVTSTPQELTDLNNTYNLVNNTLNGQIKTIHQSMAAHQAYAKVVNEGGTHLDAMNAAQGAFANENKAAFGMLNDLISVAGIEKNQANEMRATFIENMAKAQGMNLQNNPFLNTVVSNLRKKPEDDPEIARLKTLYGELQKTQQQAAEAARQIVVDDATKLITSAGDAVKKAIETARISFNEQQLNDFGLGISRPGNVINRSEGGMVYASSGKFIPRGTDTIPAMLSPGEFVVNAKATSNNLPLLNTINQNPTAPVQYFSAGTSAPVRDMGSVSQGRGVRVVVNGRSRGIPFELPRGVDPDSQLAKYIYGLWYAGPYHPRTIAAGAAAGQLNSVAPNLSASEAAYEVQRMDDAVARYNRDLFSAPSSGSRLSSRVNVLPQSAGFGQTAAAYAGDFAESAGRVRSKIGGVPSSIYKFGAGLVSGTSSLLSPMIQYANAPFAGAEAAETTLGRVGRGLIRTARGGAYAVNRGVSGLMSVAGRSNLGGAAATVGAGLAIDYALGSAGASDTVRNTTRATIDAGSTLAQAQSVGMNAASIARINLELGAQSLYEVGSAIYDTQAYIDNKIKEGDAQLAARSNITGNSYADFGLGLVSNIAGNIFGTDVSLYNPTTLIPGRGIPSAFGRLSVNTGEAYKASSRAAEATAAADARDTAMSSQTSIVGPDGTRRNFRVRGVMADQWVRRKADLEMAFKNGTITPAEYITQNRNLEADRNATNVTEGWFSDTSTRRMGVSNTELDTAVQEEISYRDAQESARKMAQKAAEEKKRKEEDDARAAKAQRNAQQAENLYNAGAAAVNVANNLWNSAVQGYQAMSTAHDELVYRTTTEQQANTILRYPRTYTTPSGMQRNTDLAAEKSAKLAKLADPNTPYEEKVRLKKDIDQINEQIVNGSRATTAKQSYNDTKKEWDAYDKNQAIATKKEEMKKIQEQKTKRNLQIQKEIALRETLAKATGFKIPDNPAQLPDWRAKVLKKIQKKFFLSGNTEKDIGLLTAYGMSPEIAKTILRPMTDAQKEAIYYSMSIQTKYSAKDLKLLRMSESDIIKQRIKAEKNNIPIAVADEKRRQELETARQKEFVKSSKLMNIYNNLADKADMAASVGVKKTLTKNLFKRMIKDGYIIPSAGPAKNAQRLSTLGLNSSAIQLLYPGQTGGILGMATGGIVYAAGGQLINFQPKGTDTVPAMLTPGEFVVNRSATKANLPLLQAINDGAQGFATGGRVNYMSDGGILGQSFTPLLGVFKDLVYVTQSTVRALQTYQKQLASTQPNSVSNSVDNQQLNGLDGLGQFVAKFDQFITALKSINLPPVVSLQVAPIQVNITGAEALNLALQGPMGEMLNKQISQAFAKLSAATEGSLQI